MQTRTVRFMQLVAIGPSLFTLDEDGRVWRKTDDDTWSQIKSPTEEVKPPPKANW